MKKYALYILIIFIALVGFFSVAGKARADDPLGTCLMTNSAGGNTPWENQTDKNCYTGNLSLAGGTRVSWTAYPGGTDTTVGYCTASDGTVARTINTKCTGAWSATDPNATGTPSQSAFQKYIEDQTCITNTMAVHMDACATNFAYYVLYMPAAWILYVAAYVFNYLISITLYTTLYTTGNFIPSAWGVVRDLSNIFFILILLYIAIQIILGLGGGGAKKMIARVIIIALLINFSLFFTEVVIDAANILALVFYNQLQTNTQNYPSAVNEKDVAGSLVGAFDPTQLLSAKFFTAAKNQQAIPMPGETTGQAPANGGKVSFGIIIGVILVAVSIMLFAAYALFVSGFYFLGRLIELFLLIIFSPFAFMSSTVPILSGTEYLGWNDWFKRLLKVAFMAPIFMFFIYLIFMLITANIFRDLVAAAKAKQSLILIIMSIAIPAVMVLMMLLKAVEFAKKGSGAIGEGIMKGAKIAGGLALGAATGGAAMLATGTLGNLASRAASSKGLNEAAKEKGLGGMAARMALKTADYGSKASFDVRKIPGAGALAKASGINMESSKIIGLGSREGGYQQRRKEAVEKRQKRAKELEVREDEPQKKALNNSEIDLQVMLNKVAKDFGNIDRELDGLRKAKADTATGSPEEKAIADKIKDLNDAKRAVKGGAGAMYTIDGVTHTVARVVVNDGLNKGATMKEMASRIIPDQKEAIETENRERKIAYAERIRRSGLNDFRTDREAAHKIIMEAKLPESGAKT